MTEQTVLMYSREHLLKYSNTRKFDPNIQAIFKVPVASRPQNEKQVPGTVERSRNLRPEPRKPEKFLTPTNAKPSGKWKTKDSLSPEPISPVARTNKTSAINRPDRQWRPNKENLENVGIVPVSKTLDVPLQAKQSADNHAEDLKPEVKKTVEKEPAFEEVKISLISASPETPTSSPSVSKVVARTPGSPSDLSLSPKSPKSGSPKVIDDHQLEQRQKQIDYGHQTLGYLRYRLLVPKDKRSRDDPRTPKKSQACSKRSWDGQIKKWRRDLHQWDPEDPVAFMAWLESEFVVQMIRNNLGTELLDLLQKIKERQAKFEGGSPAASPSPTPSPNPPRATELQGETSLDKEKVVRKLVF